MQLFGGIVMHFKKLAVAAAVSGVCFSAFAEDVNVMNIDLSSGTAFFGAMHFGGGAFTDTFTFINAPALSDVSASLVTIKLGGRQITFSSASLGGNALTLDPPGAKQTADGTFMSFAGPWTLTVKGMTAGVGGGTAHSYSGTMNVTAVPEPETYALMLAGLGAIGYMARRRKKA
jgi:hypothetical protein